MGRDERIKGYLDGCAVLCCASYFECLTIFTSFCLFDKQNVPSIMRMNAVAAAIIIIFVVIVCCHCCYPATLGISVLLLLLLSSWSSLKLKSYRNLYSKDIINMLTSSVRMRYGGL